VGLALGVALWGARVALAPTHNGDQIDRVHERGDAHGSKHGEDGEQDGEKLAQSKWELDVRDLARLIGGGRPIG